MITHQCENGVRACYPTAESSEVKDGVIHFYDVHGELVGKQELPVEAVVEEEVHVEPVLAPEPPKVPPVEPPVVAAAADEVKP